MTNNQKVGKQKREQKIVIGKAGSPIKGSAAASGIITAASIATEMTAESFLAGELKAKKMAKDKSAQNGADGAAIRLANPRALEEWVIQQYVAGEAEFINDSGNEVARKLIHAMLEHDQNRRTLKPSGALGTLARWINKYRTSKLQEG